MALFWKYIRNQLRFRPALAGGPVAVILKGMAKALDDVCADIVWARDQMNPKTCDDELVPAFAQSRGIRKHPAETFDQYRTRVVDAWAWHRMAGRHPGVERILDHYGHEGCTLSSMKPVDSTRWAEFEVSVPADAPMDKTKYDAIRDVINGAKAATAKLARVSTRTQTPSQIFAAAGLRVKTHIRL
ncbi:phage tail protein [Desulfoluna butyratoxydans]|uniref:Tail protein i n=1 Tax=Desulfoluna butyratoxydans TaxID=231438 RepID=A0A4U8YR58_9BACT|nr:phage tail protein [Desulfoluna butyratoxydans]VFQ45947.1 tail protein i [Desulfoluna butyratoxydans]